MNPIKENAIRILMYIIEKNISEVKGDVLLKKLTDLTPRDINNAVEYLEIIGAIDVQKFFGTSPYEFGLIDVNSRGKYLYYEIKKKSEVEEGKEEVPLPERIINPVGSPYGFTKKDWDFVSLRKKDKNSLYVVLGLQYKSDYYNAEKLISNIKEHFQKSVEFYNEKHSEKIALGFEKLEGGFGRHLFNKIARSIIGSDIVVFEVSDQNPNVMIELGVAQTWGIPVLPLREKKSPKPPSDMYGHTWVEYEDSGKEILDKEFHRKLLEMEEEVIAKK